MKSESVTLRNKVTKTPDFDEYQMFINGLRDGLFICRGSELLAYNKQLVEVMHLGSSEVTLTKLVNILQQTENATARNCIMRLNIGFNFGPIKLEIVNRNNQKQNLEIKSRTVNFLGKQALQVSIADITREFEVETELFETLSLLSSIFESIEEAIIILDDPDLTLQSSNASSEKTFKLNRSAYKGKSLWHLIANESDVEMLISDIWEKLPKEGVLRYNFEMKREDGVVFPAMHTVTEVHSSSGKKIAVMWIITDMTDREHLNQVLAEVEARYRILFDRAGDVIFIIDQDSLQIIDVNEAAELHIGYSRKELIGKSIQDITPKDRYEALEVDIERLKEHNTATFQGLNLTKQGTEIPVQTNMVITSFGGSDVIIAACRDISHQIEDEKERLRIEKLEAVQQVAGGIAHEFSQPMQSLVTIAEILSGNTDVNPEKQRELVKKIPPMVDRMDYLLNQMKGIVRLSTRPYIKKDSIVDFGLSTFTPRMLILDSDAKVLNAARKVASSNGIEAITALGIKNAFELLGSNSYNILLCGRLRTTSKGLAFLNDVKLHYKDIIHVYSYDSEARRMLSEEELTLCINDSLRQVRENIPT